MGRPDQRPLIRLSFVMTLNEGQEAEYEKRHNPIWEELKEALEAHGAHNYSIFLLPETRQLFGYVEVEDEEAWAAIADTEICRKWWEHMADLMATNPDSSPVVTPLREVFHME